jgi:pimeloyl-ACP methyl ester carboxylesterase
MKYTYKKTEVSYRERGEGNPVILVHGFLENQKMWDIVIDELKDTHKVYTLDLLGHGDTDGLCDIHTMEQQAVLINDLMNRNKILKATIIGHSMGGYISLAFAAMFPEKVAGLGLLNSHPFADNPEKQEARERAIKTVKRNYKAYVKAAIPSFFAPDNRDKYKNEIGKLVAEALKMSPENIIAALKGMKLREDKIELFCQRQNYPKLWIIGKKDPLIELNKIRELADRCKGTDYIELGEGHMTYVENKNEMPQVIKRFLQRNDL